MAGVFKRVNAKGETLWYATVYLDGRDHQVALREKRDGSSPVDEARARVLARSVELGLRRQPAAKRTASRRIIFKTAWPQFIADVVGAKAKNTQSDYHWSYEGHFRTAPFARKRVSNITHLDIRSYVDGKVGVLNPHTINNQTAQLAVFFQWAKQQGYWDGETNPAKAMGIRQKLAPSKVTAISNPAHAWLLLDYFDTVSDEKSQVLTATLTFAGIRWSEARSLLWSQVMVDNPKHLHLRIESTAVGDEIQDNTKSPAGNRCVGVPTTLATLLRAWRRNRMNGTLASEKVRLGIEAADGLVFPSDAGTMLSPGNFRRRQFREAKEYAHRIDRTFPLDLTVHGLRHSYTSGMLDAGATEFQVDRELGHSTGTLKSLAPYIHNAAKRGNPIAAGYAEKFIQESKKAASRSRRQIGSGPAAPTPVLPPTKGIKQTSPKQTLAARSAATAKATTKPKSASRGRATRRP